MSKKHLQSNRNRPNSALQNTLVSRTKLILGIGFTLLIGLMAAAIVFGLLHMNSIQQNIRTIVQEHNVKARLVMDMRDSIRERQVGIRNILLYQDAFDRDDEWMAFKGYAQDFIVSREALDAMPMDEQELAAHTLLRTDIRKANVLLQQILQLAIEGGRDQEAIQLMTEQVTPNQARIVAQFQAIVQKQRIASEQAFQEATSAYRTALQRMFLAGSISCVMGILIAGFVIHRIAAQSREVLQARDVAVKAAATRSLFLANMSHEIRTPMNGIIGLTTLVLRTSLSPLQHDYLQKIAYSSQSLLTIINDILDFSKIEAGKMKIETINFQLEKVLSSLMDSVQGKAADKGLEILFRLADDVPNSLIGDPLRLGQILINLCGNAIKFSKQGEILLAIKRLEPALAKKNEVLLQFSVQDPGIGLTRKQVGGLFQSFSQAESSHTREYGGTGLGLAISKCLVERMGGRIWVESEPGRGSTFYFTTLLGVQAEASPASERRAIDLQGLQALVVDDSAVARDILNHILVSFGCSVQVAESGEKALAILKDPAAPCYDLVLLDWHMPGLDGLETARCIQKQSKPDAPPSLLVVSGYDIEEIREQATGIGIGGFIRKPVSPSMVYDNLVDLLAHNVPSTLHQKEKNFPADSPLEGISSQLDGVRILLAEDNEINQDVAIGLLESFGVEVSVAANGKQAIQALKEAEQPFDAVLMDIQMPIMDGYEATHIIRADPAYKDLPIIAMTAHAMAGEWEKSLSAGMNDHLTKPVDPQALFRSLCRWTRPGLEPLDIPTDELVHGSRGGLPERLPGLDISSGLRRVGGNHELYRKLLKDFRAHYRDVVEALEDGLLKRDLASILRAMHALKGVAGNIGAHTLQKASQGLEQAATGSIMEQGSQALGVFREALDELLSSIAHLLPEQDAKNSDSSEANYRKIDQPKVLALIVNMSRFLEKDQYQVKEGLSGLRKLLQQTQLEQHCMKLSEYIDDYDLDAAQKQLRSMQDWLETNDGVKS